MSPPPEIPLTRGQRALVDPGDYERIAAHKWHCNSKGYAERTDRSGNTKRRVYMHREIIGDPPPGLIVDHINGVRTDNRRSNLRFVTPSENNANTPPYKSRCYKGVYSHRRKWKAEITWKGERTYLGLFGTPEDAAEAYDCAALQLMGECARLNRPTREAPQPLLSSSPPPFEHREQV